MALREQLKVITDVMDTTQHAQLLAELSETAPNTVEIVEVAQEGLDFNCVMLALDLAGWVDPPCNVLGHYHAGLEFLAHLLETGVLQPVDLPGSGDLAVYLEGEQLRHVGIFIGESRIRSKWGSGHTYEHHLWEVPQTYGCSIRYYSPIDGEVAQQLLVQFKGW